jgi:hypothetical protein
MSDTPTNTAAAAATTPTSAEALEQILTLLSLLDTTEEAFAVARACGIQLPLNRGHEVASREALAVMRPVAGVALTRYEDAEPVDDAFKKVLREQNREKYVNADGEDKASLINAVRHLTRIVEQVALKVPGFPTGDCKDFRFLNLPKETLCMCIDTAYPQPEYSRKYRAEAYLALCDVVLGTEPFNLDLWQGLRADYRALLQEQADQPEVVDPMLLRKVTALRSNGMSDVYNALVTTSTLSTWDKPAIDAAAEAAVPQPAGGANATEVRGRNQHVKAMKKWLRRKEWLGNHDALLILHTVWCDGTNGRRFHRTTGRRNEYGWTWLGYIEDDGSVAIYHRDGGSTKYADLDAAHAVLKNCMLVTRDGLNGHIYVSDYKAAEMHEVFHQGLDVAHTMLIRTVIEERRATISATRACPRATRTTSCS